MPKPLRIFTVNLTGEPEFYATRAYEEGANGRIVVTGKSDDVTRDVTRYIREARNAVFDELAQHEDDWGVTFAHDGDGDAAERCRVQAAWYRQQKDQS